MEHSDLDLDDVQGNIIGGFNKDFQTAITCQVIDTALCRSWVSDQSSKVASATETLAFKNLHKLLTRRRTGKAVPIESTWMNIAFSAEACSLLGLPCLMDGANAKELFGDDKGYVHILLGSDARDRLEAAVQEVIKNLRGLIPVCVDTGSVRPGVNSGFEHFGYNDRIAASSLDMSSGVDTGGPIKYRYNSRISDVIIGNASDLIEVSQAKTEPSQDPSAPFINGSMLVYWKLSQNPIAFDQFIEESVDILNCTSGYTDWNFRTVAGLVMGRYFDGRLTSDRRVSTPGGCPFGAHISKATAATRHTPTSEPADGWAILRRGIPYGTDEAMDRGLLFMSYQASIRRQFEQRIMFAMGNSDFPTKQTGVDPFIGPMLTKKGASEAAISVVVSRPEGGDCVVVLPIRKPFVTSEHGGYYYVPGIRELGGG